MHACNSIADIAILLKNHEVFFYGFSIIKTMNSNVLIADFEFAEKYTRHCIRMDISNKGYIPARLLNVNVGYIFHECG